MPKPEIIKGPFVLDGQPGFYRVRCPGCKVLTIVDPDQAAGKVSMQCDCGYHETHVLIEVSGAV